MSAHTWMGGAQLRWAEAPDEVELVEGELLDTEAEEEEEEM